MKASFPIDSGVFFLARYAGAITRGVIGLPRGWVVSPVGDAISLRRNEREV